MSESLFNRVRPAKLDELVGQPETVESLAALFKHKKLPHVILLTGPSGCGKTTIARQIVTRVGCTKDDFTEYAADRLGIATVRDVIEHSRYKPMGRSKARVWLFDECHKMTEEAQNAFLIPLENPKPWVYYILATTNPAKLSKTVVGRCTHFRLNPLGREDLLEVLRAARKRETIKAKDAVLDKIAESADGSARQALVLLEQVMFIPKTAGQLAALEKAGLDGPVGDLVAAVFGFGKAHRFLVPNWPEAAGVLAKMRETGEDAEGIRHKVLQTCGTLMLKNGYQPLGVRAKEVADVFQYNFYDTKLNGLISATYQVCAPKGRG